MRNITELPLKDSFKIWMTEEGIAPASAGSYCSYATSACKNLMVKYSGEKRTVFDAIQLSIDKKDIEAFQHMMTKVIHLYYNRNYLNRIDRPESTIRNWRTGLNCYQEYVSQYLNQEVEECDIDTNNIVFDYEEIKSENTTEITKDELYNNFKFRLITQDRYYENIMYPIGLIKRLFFKTGRKHILDNYLTALIDNTLICVPEGTISIANIKSLLIDTQNEEVYIITHENKKLQVFTPTHGNCNIPLKVKSLSQISLDHILPMHNIMTQNEEKLGEMLKLTQVIKERVKGSINYKTMKATYSSIIRDADNLEEYIDFTKIEKELAFLLENGKLQLMDKCENTRKGKN